MNAHFFDHVARLEREHASFAIATVVARRSPVSSHLGDRALVFADGHMEGFVGGSCSRDIVRRQALGAIRSRRPVLLQIRNAAGTDVLTPGAGGADGTTTERVVIPMSCASEGAVDVYIEPRVPSRRLIVVGFTPVANALAQLASTLEFNVTRVVVDDELRDIGEQAGIEVLALGTLSTFLAALDAGERAGLIAIVASQGHYDELALDVVQAFDVGFIGLLASRRRAATVFGVLAQQGVPAERIANIRNPVGLDIGARNPGEVAVSILAEIIAAAPIAATVDAPQPAIADADTATTSATETDPICGMDVETAGALYRYEHAARTYVFCCAGCRATFAAEPARFLAALGNV